MQYAKLELNEIDFYTIFDYNNAGLYTLGGFLNSSINNDFSYEFFTSWLKDIGNLDSAYGNAYALTPYQEKILIHLQFFIVKKEPYGDDPCAHFTTTREELLKIIDDWVQVVVQAPKPKEILIVHDNGKVIIKAKNIKIK